MDRHKYQKLLYWKDFVMNCFCIQIFCDHLIVMRYFVMGDHVMAINVPLFPSVSSPLHGRFFPFVHILGSIVGNGGKDFGIEIIFWVWGLGDVVRHGMNCCNNWRGQDVEGRGDVEIVSAVGEV